jgi:lambda family phage portal protein
MWNPLSGLKKYFTRTVTKVVHARGRQIKAGYDLAQTGIENRNHWGAADELGPLLSLTTPVRAIMRKRARYEKDNNPHLNSIIKTHVNNFIGTGPRLQLLLGQEHYQSSRLVEQSFAAWVKAVDFGEKMRMMAAAQPIDGACFGLMFENPMLPNPIKLDIRVLEDEQVTTPTFASLFDSSVVDGIELDEFGNPSFYHVLKEHPGDAQAFGAEYDRVPAKFMVHWYRPSRPGQMRGCCEFASSLQVGAQSRRYAAAVIAKAESTANIVAVMETPAAMDAGDPIPIETMEEFDLPRNAFLTMPAGSTGKVFDAGTTTTGFKEFQSQQHSSLGRPVLMPRNLVTGDSSDFNFASGKIDQLPFYQSMWIERDRFAARVLNLIFKAWYTEANALGLIPDDLPSINEWNWDWQWDGFPSIDALKDAKATELKLQLNLTTLSEECAADGKNWRDVIDQRALEREYMLSKGIDPDASQKTAAPVTQPSTQTNNPANVPQDQEDFADV